MGAIRGAAAAAWMLRLSRAKSASIALAMTAAGILFATAAVAQAAPAATDICNIAREPTKVFGGSLTVTTSKSWQPRGGEFKFFVSPPAAIPSGALIKVCFRWSQQQETSGKYNYVESPATRVIELKTVDRQSITIGAIVPELLAAPARTAADAEPTNQSKPVGVWQGFHTVPVADVRILIYRAGTDSKPPNVDYDLVTTVGVTYLPTAVILAILTVLVTLALLGLVIGQRLQQPNTNMSNLGWGSKISKTALLIVSTEKGFASLSQFQIVLWTLVVAASAVYVMALSGDLIVISQGTLVLLGISGAATVLSKYKSAVDDKKPTPVAQAAPVAPVPAAPVPAAPVAPAPVAQVPAAPAPVAPAPAAQAGFVRPGGPRWADLVIDYKVQPNGPDLAQVDVTRVQMLLFTLVTAGFATMKVLTSYEIPEIPEGYLILMGISNGVYLGSKFAAK